MTYCEPAPEVKRLQAEIADLAARLEAARDALLAERFKDVPRRAAGDLVLVPRKLFGKVRWWPAKIVNVHLSYSSGEDANGQPWERHHVSYAVFLQQQDGTFGGTSQGYYGSEVQSVPASAADVRGGQS